MSKITDTNLKIFKQAPVRRESENDDVLSRKRGGGGMYIPQFEHLQGGLLTRGVFEQIDQMSDRLDDAWVWLLSTYY
jgi:hypothetical protein